MAEAARSNEETGTGQLARAAWTGAPANYNILDNDPMKTSTARCGRPCRMIFCGGAGNLSYVGVDGVTVVFTGVIAGSFIPIQANALNAASTCTNVNVIW